MTGLDTALVLGDEAAVGTPIATLLPKVTLGLAVGNAALSMLGAPTSSARLVRLPEASYNSLKDSGKDLNQARFSAESTGALEVRSPSICSSPLSPL